MLNGFMLERAQVGPHRVPPPEVLTLTPHQQMLIRHIRDRWSDTLRTNLEIGECLIELGIRKKDWKLNFFDLPFGYSWGKRLIKIAKDQRIRDQIGIMPDARNTLHQISLLNDRQFERALSQQVIRRNCTRQDIIDWRRLENGVKARVIDVITYEVEGEQSEPEEKAWQTLDVALVDVARLLSALHPHVQIRHRSSLRPIRSPSDP